MINKWINTFFYFFIILLFSLFFPAVSDAYVLTDDFNDGIMDDWIRVDDLSINPCNAQWKEENGMIGIDINERSCATNLMPSDNLWNGLGNNYIIDVDVKFVAGVDHNIAFRFKPNTPTNDWYELHFRSPDEFVLDRIYPSPVYVTYPVPNKDDFYHLKIIVDTDNIKIFIDGNLALNHDRDPATEYFPEGRFAFRAGVGSSQISETWFDNLVVTDIDIPESLDPIVFLPGMGGSWNTSDIISGGNSGGSWKATPFINVYDNLKSSFIDSAGYEEDKNYFEFYYDWRKPVDVIADDLNDFITSEVSPNIDAQNKIDLVGHSMGGLVARAYVQKYGEDKIDQVVTSGSPHQGAIPAWQAWSGAELGDRWSWQWIVLQLYLHIHQGRFSSPVTAIHSLSPSLADLSPNFNFLKDSNDNEVSVSSMNFVNTYLQGLNSNLTQDIKDFMDTISGEGSDSTEWVKVEVRNLADKLLKKWPDGKPIEFIKTNEGDGTILKKSALIENTNQNSVNSSHINLAFGNDGIQAIFNSLGLSESPVSLATAIPRNPSLLFFLHSPAEMTVTAPSGSQAGAGVASPMSNSMYFPEDKLLLIYNAEDGDYQVEVKGLGEGEYQLDLGQLTETQESFSSLESATSPNQADSYTFTFNSSSPQDNPWKDDSGETSLELAKYQLASIKSSLQPGIKSYRYLLRLIDQLISFINKADKQAEKGNFARAQQYAKIVMRGCYLLRIKLDNSNLDNTDKVALKEKANVAGKLLLESYINFFSKSSKSMPNKLVSRSIKNVERLTKKLERRIGRKQSVSEEAGNTYSLILDYLSRAKDGDNKVDQYGSTLIARILLLELSRLL